MVETHKKEKKYMTISNGEHIKHTLDTSKPYRHQQHLPKISPNVSGAVRMAIRYGRNTCTASITAMLELLNNFIKTRLCIV